MKVGRRVGRIATLSTAGAAEMRASRYSVRTGVWESYGGRMTGSRSQCRQPHCICRSIGHPLGQSPLLPSPSTHRTPLHPSIQKLDASPFPQQAALLPFLF